MGELARSSKKEFSDAEIISIIKKMMKNEQEVLTIKGEDTSEYLQILETFIPQQASEVEIIRWIGFNIDFSELNNKMQAMKPIMDHFGTSADGNIVKEILIKNF